MLQLPPLSLYIHIPWCVRKCPYCDFNSHEPSKSKQGRVELPEEQYLQALEEDLRDSAQYAQGRPLDSLFFGGGTPSIVNATTIAACIDMADRLVGISPDAEITMEANPGTFEQEKFHDFRAAGVNRLSIGIQSFHSAHLKALGRIHDSSEALRAVAIAQDAGFDNINIDLMHGLPNQTCTEAMADLEQAIALNPNHISWYELTIEPNTAFYSQPPVLPDEDDLSDINEKGMALLQKEGYKRYEVSAYAKSPTTPTGKAHNQTANDAFTSDLRCRHNLNYWTYGDYLGIGAGAHEKVTLPTEGRIIRRSKTRLPEHYLKRIGSRVASQKSPTQTELPFEFCMNALRLIEGASTQTFESHTGLSVDILQTQLHENIKQKLVAPIHPRIRATESGVRYLNTVLESLLPESR